MNEAARPVILLFGKNGQLGWELRRTLAPLGSVIALGRDDGDLRDTAGIERTVRAARPAVIVNAAAYTAVDRAEQDRDCAFAVNADAAGVLAREAARAGALLVHFSTDYVFDGRAAEPYREQDDPAPVNVYGESKLAGERAIAEAGGRHLILRSCWLYELRGRNFLQTILRKARNGEAIEVVHDQVGCPTWSRALAEATAQALARLATGSGFALDPTDIGVYHLGAAGRASRYDFARAILRHDAGSGGHAPRPVTPVSSEDVGARAQRPPFSVLDSSRFAATFRLWLPHWEDQLARALEDEPGRSSYAFDTPKVMPSERLAETT